MIRVIIVGALGKMGQSVFDAIKARPTEFTVIAGVDAGAVLTSDASPFPIYPSIEQVTQEADAVIDFSRPEALSSLLSYCAEHGLFLITGTTGLTDTEKTLMDKFALRVPIFASGNMSLGVNLQLQLVKRAASILGDKFETEIIEKHHHFKVDAPSGTALMLADAVSSQIPGGLKNTYGRYTRTERRRPDELGIHSIRGGTIVGEHEVSFIGEDEIVEVTHKAYSKRIFVQGALRAAEFMMGKQPGLYNMQDIVLENDVFSHLYATDDQCILRITGLIGCRDIYGIFNVLASKGVFVDMISMDAPGALSISLPMKHAFTARDELETLISNNDGASVTIIPNVTKIVVEGIGMEFRHGIAAQVFEALFQADVDMLMITTSETKISCAIDTENAAKGLNALADYLDL